MTFISPISSLSYVHSTPATHKLEQSAFTRTSNHLGGIAVLPNPPPTDDDDDDVLFLVATTSLLLVSLNIDLARPVL